MFTTAQVARCPRRRRNYLINPGFQWKHAGLIALSVFLLSTTVSAVLYVILHQQARALSTNPMGYSPKTTVVMVSFGFSFAALTAGGVGLWSILMTHRICGPLFVFKRYLSQIAEGRLPSLRPLRQKDEFADLHQALEGAVESLRSQKRQELAALNAALEAVHRVPDPDHDSARLDMGTVVCKLEWLRERTSHWLAEIPEDQAATTHAARSPQAEPQVSCLS